jgi:D-alanyl-lipoteichoic acid acyltransferase DltB (MBOAT superfamily)
LTLDNSAEKLLGTINVIFLVICCLAAFILVGTGIDSYREGYLVGVGIGLAVLGAISYACVNVVLNISNNLHQINSKMK